MGHRPWAIRCAQERSHMNLFPDGHGSFVFMSLDDGSQLTVLAKLVDSPSTLVEDSSARVTLVQGLADGLRARVTAR
jgi:hypothetical protein